MTAGARVADRWAIDTDFVDKLRTRPCAVCDQCRNAFQTAAGREFVETVMFALADLAHLPLCPEHSVQSVLEA